MILSASRRTDLPCAHAEWLCARFRAGETLVRNPMNPRRVSRVSLRREDVDGIVFWSKNPRPLMARLDAFDGYAYYFQFTLNGYGPEIEPNLPGVAERLATFRALSGKIGPERVLWRYDPILLSRVHSEAWHEDCFGRLAEALRGCTQRATISFLDIYARNRSRLLQAGAAAPDGETMHRLAAKIARTARANGMEPCACAEATDFGGCGVARARCVDAELLGRIGGIPLRAPRDPNQRAECGCAVSVDLGTYNTCPNGCVYCYANFSPSLLRERLNRRNDASPLLCDALSEGDCVTERKCASLREGQLRMEW